MYVKPGYHSANQNYWGQGMEKLYWNGYPSARSSQSNPVNQMKYVINTVPSKGTNELIAIYML